MIGYGTSSDARDPVRPNVDGAVAAITNALDAKLTSDAIDYVDGHGTATIVNDWIESEALGIVFGRRARELPVSSTKRINGHALGATGPWK